MKLTKILRVTGHGIALLWAGFWIAAGAKAGLTEAHTAGEAVRFTLIPGGLFLLLVALMWHWERIGAWMVLLCGLALLGTSSLQPQAAGPMLLLAGPPLLGGLILLVYGRVKTPASA